MFDADFGNPSNSPGLNETGLKLKEIGLGNQVKGSLRIDRLTLLLEVNEFDQETVVPHVYAPKYDPDMAGADGIVPAGSKAKQGATAALHAKVPVSTNPLIWSQANAATVQVRSKATEFGKKRFLRVEFSPLGLTPEGFGHLYDHLLRGYLFLSHQEILAARVSRVDAAFDLHGVRLQNYAWTVANRSVARSWVNKGVLQTLYLGSQKHNAPCFYDKGAQQKLDESAAWTRLEMRPDPKMALATLSALKNPFNAVSVHDVRAACAKRGLAVPLQEMALAFAQLRGVRRLPELFPGTKGPGGNPAPRVLWDKALEASVPGWWKPEAIWQLWPLALAFAMPPIFGGIQGAAEMTMA